VSHTVFSVFVRQNKEFVVNCLVLNYSNLWFAMDQTSFQAVTKLEQKLEQNRLQRQKLKHELGKIQRDLSVIAVELM
jgi:hypothetical protein